MKRTLLTLVALAVGITVIAVAWRSRGGRETPPPAPGPGAAMEEAEPGSPPITEVPAGGGESAPEVVELPAAADPEASAGAQDPPGGIPVLVVTPDGIPVAGVPVALLARIGSRKSAEGCTAEATTDARGRALLVEGEDKRKWREGIEKLDRVEVLLRVEARILFPARPSHVLGNDLTVTDPIRLVLPASGSIRVHVSTPDGEPMPDQVPVFPLWRPVGSDENYGRIGSPSEMVVDGVATFPVLMLGHEFQLKVSGGGEYGSTQAFVVGPTHAGEVIDVDVVLGPPLVTITGLLVGEEGVPLTDVSVSMAPFTLDRNAPAGAEPERIPWQWQQLDGEGRFRFVTALELDDSQHVALMVHEVSRRTRSERDRVARWDGIVQLNPDEDFDVGTLVLRDHPARRFLVAGRVLSEDGEPLHNARTHVSFRNPETQRWTQLAENRVRVEGDGFFETFTTQKEVPAHFTVTAGADGHLDAMVEASLGDREVELLLRRSSGLSGRFVTGNRAARRLLAVLIQGEDFERELEIVFGEFRVDDLPPGTYSVIAKGHGTDWRYGGIEGVVVPRGGFADDPRLERIDLGDACRILRLTVLDPDGQPIPKHDINVNDQANDGGNFRTGQDGEMVALVPATAAELDLTVFYQGKRLGILWSASSGYTGTIALAERAP